MLTSKRQHQWMISLFGMYACALIFMYRSAISVALVYMTEKDRFIHEDNNNNHNQTVQQSNDSFVSSNFHWNQKIQGTILSASFYLYWCLPTIIGTLTDRYGGKWFIFTGVLGPCLLSALAPFFIENYGGHWPFICIQTIVGGFHGFTYPALFSLYSRWFDSSAVLERGQANSLMQVGNAIGCFFMYLLAGHLCTWTSLGWHLVFYVVAILHLPWLLLWIIFGSNGPNISDSSESIRQSIVNSKVNHKTNKKGPTPWLSILCSPVVWSSVICKMCCAFGFFLLLNKMPSYFSMVFKLDIRDNGLISAMVMASYGLTSFLSPFIAGYLIQNGIIRSILAKKISQNIAMVGPAICLMMIPYYSEDKTLVFALIILSMLLHGFFTSGEWTIVSDYAKNFSGSIIGFVHSLAFLMGVLAPMIVGFIFESNSIGETIIDKWNVVFYITATTYLFGNVIFMIFGTDQQQDWDKI